MHYLCIIWYKQGSDVDGLCQLQLKLNIWCNRLTKPARIVCNGPILRYDLQLSTFKWTSCCFHSIYCKSKEYANVAPICTHQFDCNNRLVIFGAVTSQKYPKKNFFLLKTLIWSVNNVDASQSESKANPMRTNENQSETNENLRFGCQMATFPCFPSSPLLPPPLLVLKHSSAVNEQVRNSSRDHKSLVVDMQMSCHSWDRYTC